MSVLELVVLVCSVPQMLTQGRYSWVSERLEEWISESGELAVTESQQKVLLVSFDRELSGIEASVRLCEESKRHFSGLLVAADFSQLLAVGKDFPDLQLQRSVVALGTAWKDRFHGNHHVAYLGSHGDKRFVGLNYTSSEQTLRWPAGTIFLCYEQI